MPLVDTVGHFGYVFLILSDSPNFGKVQRVYMMRNRHTSHLQEGQRVFPFIFFLYKLCKSIFPQTAHRCVCNPKAHIDAPRCSNLQMLGAKSFKPQTQTSSVNGWSQVSGPEGSSPWCAKKVPANDLVERCWKQIWLKATRFAHEVPNPSPLVSEQSPDVNPAQDQTLTPIQVQNNFKTRVSFLYTVLN